MFLLFSLIYFVPSKANECKQLFIEGDLVKAKQTCLKPASLGSDEHLWSKLILFDIAHYLGDQDQAYINLLEISKLDLSDNIQYELLRRQGRYYRLQKRYKYASSYYQDALDIAIKQYDKVKIAKSYNDFGLIELKSKNYLQSIEYFHKSLILKKQLNNKVLIRTTLTNLGLLYYRTGDFLQAIEYYKQAESILTQLSKEKRSKTLSTHQTIHLYSYMAAAYEKAGDFLQSQDYLSRLEQGISLIANENEVLNRHLNLVEVLIENKSYFVAKTILDKVHFKYKKPDFNNAQLYFQMAFVEYQLKNIDISRVYAEKSLQETEKHQSKAHLAELYLLFSNIEKEFKNPEQALIWLEKSHKIKVNDIENQVNLDFKNLKYEQSLEFSKSRLIQEKMNRIILEKSNYIYLITLLAVLSSFLLVVFYYFYQRKLMLKNNLLLNKDIEHHKQICAILEKPPISFKQLLHKKKYPIIVLDENKQCIFNNFLNNKSQLSSFMELLNSSDMEKFLEMDMLAKENKIIPFKKSSFDKLIDMDQLNIQKVLTGQYSIVSFSNKHIELDLETEINALSQFEFYLSQNSVCDSSYLRKIIVDCMNTCLNIWEKVTLSNRIEFADQSKVWKINIDEGRLRTRSLDKYLSTNTIPKNPRVNQVIKSCHFMLTLDKIKPIDRTKIEFYLQKLQ